jgi:hypothetical protein
MKVRLYDGEEAKIPREEAFKLTSEKFEHDVNYIIECETRWVGQAVVANKKENKFKYYLNDKCHIYHPWLLQLVPPIEFHTQ